MSELGLNRQLAGAARPATVFAERLVQDANQAQSSFPAAEIGRDVDCIGHGDAHVAQPNIAQWE
jgi:hypothetical protein